jgi:hypothetical protein
MEHYEVQSLSFWLDKGPDIHIRGNIVRDDGARPHRHKRSDNNHQGGWRDDAEVTQHSGYSSGVNPDGCPLRRCPTTSADARSLP